MPGATDWSARQTGGDTRDRRVPRIVPRHFGIATRGARNTAIIRLNDGSKGDSKRSRLLALERQKVFDVLRIGEKTGPAHLASFREISEWKKQISKNG